MAISKRSNYQETILESVWDQAGTEFKALRIEVTDTASDPNSSVMDLQINGGSVGNMRKDGQLNLAIPLPAVSGGTGASNATDARNNLGLGDVAILNSPIPVASGGTGAISPAQARTNLGINDAATLTTPIQILDGGTGSTTASGARTNLGLGDVAILNSPISVANGGTGSITASGARTNLGLGDLAIINSPLPLANGGTGSTTDSGARSNLGLGDVAVLNSPIPVLNGGTGSTTASGARTNLGLGSLAVINSPLPVADGGTGSTTASGGLANLGGLALTGGTLTGTVQAPAFQTDPAGAKYTSYSGNADIVALVPGTTSGALIESSDSGHVVVGINANDTNDGFHIISTNTSPTESFTINLLAVTRSSIAYQNSTIWHAGNDGASSGLDADLLDGLQSTQFLRSDTTDTTTGSLTVNGVVISDELRNRSGNGLVLNAGESAGQATGQTAEFVYANAESGLQVNASPDNWVSGWAGRVTTTISSSGIVFNGNTVWHAGNDGAGSGLDADLLDGQNSVSGASTANTVAARNGSGDIHVRLLRSSFPADSSVTGSFFLTQNAAGSDGADNFARPMSISAVRNALGGSGSGLNADQLDGIDSSGFIRNNAAGDFNIASSSSSSSYTSAALEVRELNFGGAQTGADAQAPRVSFHWSGRVAAQLGLDASGRLRTYDNPGTGFNDFHAKSFFTQSGGTFNGTATSARYADLAERFHSDAHYEPGTLVIIGGKNEITCTKHANCEDVFGIISTNPGLMMNSDAGEDETHPYVALSGRVPILIAGKIKKGQRIVSSSIHGIGMAATEKRPNLYTVVGRSLENKDTEEVGKVMAVVLAK